MATAKLTPDPMQFQDVQDILDTAKDAGLSILKLDEQIDRTAKRLKQLKDERESFIGGLVKTVTEGKQETLSFSDSE